MLDTMTLTKVVGSLCGALLVFLLGNWVAEEVYHMGGGHGEEHAAGYYIEVETAEEEAEEELEEEEDEENYADIDDQSEESDHSDPTVEAPRNLAPAMMTRQNRMKKQPDRFGEWV